MDHSTVHELPLLASKTPYLLSSSAVNGNYAAGGKIVAAICSEVNYAVCGSWRSARVYAGIVEEKIAV